MGLTFTESAERHGFTEEDAIHAIENSKGRAVAFTEPRPPSTLRPDLFIGPVGPYDQRLIEVYVEIRPHRGGVDLTIFHVMLASEDNLNRIGRSYRR